MSTVFLALGYVNGFCSVLNVAAGNYGMAFLNVVAMIISFANTDSDTESETE